MASKFSSMAEAINRGNVAALTRLDKGVPNMLKLLPILRPYAGDDIPLEYLVVKGAWESAGRPGTTSKSGQDVGLFQLIVRPGQKTGGYTATQLKDPRKNTEVFTGRVRNWVKSLQSIHGDWFTDGDSKQLWGVVWLFGAIGSHATRTILNHIGPGPKTFDRIVQFTKSSPAWFKTQTEHWGRQDPTLVVFRIIIGKRVMDRAWALNLSSGGSGALASGGGFLLLAAAGGVGYWAYRRGYLDNVLANMRRGVRRLTGGRLGGLDTFEPRYRRRGGRGRRGRAPGALARRRRLSRRKRWSAR